MQRKPQARDIRYKLFTVIQVHGWPFSHSFLLSKNTEHEERGSGISEYRGVVVMQTNSALFHCRIVAYEVNEVLRCAPSYTGARSCGLWLCCKAEECRIGID
jgi:hypothetical protein